MPAVGQGHGKNGRIIKVDHASALISFLLPNATQTEKDTILLGMLGRSAQHLDPKKGNKHVPDILKAFRSLDPTDQKEFTELYQVASDELLLQEKRDGKARVQTLPKQPRKHLTPLSLQDLCPPAAGCRITRHPVLRRPTDDDIENVLNNFDETTGFAGLSQGSAGTPVKKDMFSPKENRGHSPKGSVDPPKGIASTPKKASSGHTPKGSVDTPKGSVDKEPATSVIPASPVVPSSPVIPSSSSAAPSSKKKVEAPKPEEGPKKKEQKKDKEKKDKEKKDKEKKTEKKDKKVLKKGLKK
eukprot:s261_g21.t1